MANEHRHAIRLHESLFRLLYIVVSLIDNLGADGSQVAIPAVSLDADAFDFGILFAADLVNRLFMRSHHN